MIRIISQHPAFQIFIFAAILLLLSSQDNTGLYGEDTHKILKETSSKAVIRIVFTGEENGYLEPCGCSEKEIGGLPRRHALINLLREENQDIIILSLGDIPDKTGRQGEIKMEITLEALGQMGYAAHNIGEKDINMGLDLLGYLSHISNVDFISSNILLSDSRLLRIKPYIIKEIETGDTTLRAGILGIVSPQLIEDGYEEIQVSDPVDSLKPLLSSLEGKTDILILLSHADMEDSIKIAAACPEFDLIISGHNVDMPDLYIKKVNDTYVIPAGEKGKYLGTVTLSPGRTPYSYLPVKNPEYYGPDNGRLESVVEIISLDERFEDSPEMKILLRAYQQKLKDEELIKQVFKTYPPSNLAFTGNDDCALCHNKIFRHWEGTGHASAYETLVKAEHENDPECLGCHTIGLNFYTGFETIESTPGLRGVGCESCHGPGSSHKETQSKDYGRTDAGVCIICHEGEHSPNFQYEDYWQKIKHPPEK